MMILLVVFGVLVIYLACGIFTARSQWKMNELLRTRGERGDMFTPDDTMLVVFAWPLFRLGQLYLWIVDVIHQFVTR